MEEAPPPQPPHRCHHTPPSGCVQVSQAPLRLGRVSSTVILKVLSCQHDIHSSTLASCYLVLALYILKKKKKRMAINEQLNIIDCFVVII